MFTFSLVRRIGEGSYLDEDSFILERVRKERALNTRCVRFAAEKNKTRIFARDGKPRPA